jgi:hypothetical protein
MKQRTRANAVQYYNAPPEARPAMADIDAVSLWADLLRSNLPVPEEVRMAGMLQANEDAPEGTVTLIEEYHGRLRLQNAMKSARG